MSESIEKPRILLVDDKPENIDVLAELLQADYQILVALNGEKALEIAEKESPPDIILLDVLMPEMDGYEVCRRLKANEKTSEIPVIFVTAMNDVNDETKGFELGAVDFIIKPLSPAIVRARVKTQLALKEARNKMEDFSEKLSRYVSPQIKKSIFEGNQDARIGASRKQLSVFFSDIVGFTTMTDTLEPEDLTLLLNSYLDRMARIALEHSGTVDKFIGDAVLVFFGDPESRGIQQDALSCVEMALDMQMAVDELKADWVREGIVNDFHVRMGITTGYCTVGNFGSEARMDYTIVGNQVNLASRLESNAAPGCIMISEETHLLVRDKIACAAKEPIDAKGFAQPVPVYQVVGPQSVMTEGSKIAESRSGFSISLDPSAISEEDRHDILERLRAAICLLH
ncbi:MAG: response regulator [Verrucomicrobiales bacterium]|nr:response regulator [Verrucomicrobiales bacterium]